MKVRNKGGFAKRSFKAYSSPKQAGWDRPGGGGEAGDPYELSMKQVRLVTGHEPFGMDEGRKRKLRRMIWYWQWSRDWNWRQITTVSGIQPENQTYRPISVPSTDEEQNGLRRSTWYWRWSSFKKKRDAKQESIAHLNRCYGSELLHWMVSLNTRWSGSERREAA